MCCIVLTGSDHITQVLCTGIYHNEKENPSITQKLVSWRLGLTLSFYNCTKHIVAALDGNVVGVITMTLLANIRIVSEQAKVGFRVRQTRGVLETYELLPVTSYCRE